MRILITGGAGYIGSHTAVELLNNGYDVVILDNFDNSNPKVISQIEKITGKNVIFYEVDVNDKALISKIFKDNKIDCVIHFAGLKAVGESVKLPIKYYRNNIDTTLTLLECMQEEGVNRIVFSSSATVYGEENTIPYIETMNRGNCSSPYGWTKAMNEKILEDAVLADPNLSVILLRYFNPIGAHESGLIGENPKGIPNNLMPYIVQVAIGEREQLTIFGNDYNTLDGTCRRDYIHVMDLASGHVNAVEYCLKHKGLEIFNLGTGNPYSVLEIINAFENATGQKIKYVIGDRRSGDLPEFWANSNKAKQLLGWTAKRNIIDMCKDSYNYITKIKL